MTDNLERSLQPHPQHCECGPCNDETHAAQAAPVCEHFYHHKCHRGVSIGICSICGDPNWIELLNAKADRDRLWRCLFDAQAQWINDMDGKAHAGWQVALVQTGAPT